MSERGRLFSPWLCCNRTPGVSPCPRPTLGEAVTAPSISSPRDELLRIPGTWAVTAGWWLSLPSPLFLMVSASEWSCFFFSPALAASRAFTSKEIWAAVSDEKQDKNYGRRRLGWPSATISAPSPLKPVQRFLPVSTRQGSHRCMFKQPSPSPTKVECRQPTFNVHSHYHIATLPTLPLS